MKIKKGQFYLIAALIIIVSLIGLASVTNYVITKKDVKKQSLESDLKLQSSEVLEFAVENQENIGAIMEAFLQDYSSYIEDENYEAIFIYGDEQSISENIVYVVYPEDIESEISLQKDSGKSVWTFVREAYITTPVEIKNVDGIKIVTIEIGGTNFEPFEIKEGQTFYFILQQPKDDDEVNEEN